MRKFISYLSLDRIGFLELLFAFYCILSGYSWGAIKGNLFFMVVMALIAFARQNKSNIQMRELKWLIAFVVIHEILLAVMINAPGYMINNTISAVLLSICIIPIVKALDFEKLKGAINLVAIISIGGIAYHFAIIRSGGCVTPIPLPFLPELETGSRLFEEGFRPTSFYWEPAAFVTYMMVPLFLSLFERKFTWTVIIMASMFFSTSTTGITMSLLMLIVYVLTQDIRIRTKVAVVLLTGVFVWLLFTSEIFSAGMEKISETDIESTSRTINGPAMVFNMPFMDLLIGMPAANPYDYLISGGFHSNEIIVKENSIFVSTFWLVLAKFGVIGLALFLSLYIRPLINSREILTYIIMLFASMFFQSYSFGTGGFAFQIIFIYLFTSIYNRQNSLV